MKTLSMAALFAALLHVGAGTSAAQPFHDPFVGHNPGGTMLGIYAVESPHGLRVVGTVDGFSAHGRLLPNDILMRATADNLPIFSINTHERMEYAKMMIGANRIAGIEFFRPGVGNMYAWMTFELNCTTPHATLLGITPGAGTTFEAEFVLESERPGAQELFAPAAAAAVAAPATAPAAAAVVEGEAPADAPAAVAPAEPAPDAGAVPAQPLQPAQPGAPAASEDALDSLFN
jgi:hypothetical protein